MVKLSHLIALAAGLCLYTANATTSTDLPDLPSIAGFVGGGLYRTKSGGGGGTTTGGSPSGDGLTVPEDVTTDDGTNSNDDETTNEDGTGDIPEAENGDGSGESGEDISVNDPTTVSNPFPKGGVRIHKSNKTSKSNKDGGNSVKDTNGGTAKSVTTSTYLRG